MCTLPPTLERREKMAKKKKHWSEDMAPSGAETLAQHIAMRDAARDTVHQNVQDWENLENEEPGVLLGVKGAKPLPQFPNRRDPFPNSNTRYNAEGRPVGSALAPGSDIDAGGRKKAEWLKKMYKRKVICMHFEIDYLQINIVPINSGDKVIDTGFGFKYQYLSDVKQDGERVVKSLHNAKGFSKAEIAFYLLRTLVFDCAWAVKYLFVFTIPLWKLVFHKLPMVLWSKRMTVLSYLKWVFSGEKHWARP